MSNYNQPQETNYPPTETRGGYMSAPPPAGFPVKDGEAAPPANTQPRGDGFWRGCCAGLCCCCLLDACF